MQASKATRISKERRPVKLSRVARPPSRRARMAVSLLAGGVSAFFCRSSISNLRLADDFSWYWLGARALLAGKDPYVVVQPGGPFHLDAPFVYPLTTAIIASPFAWLRADWAAVAFVGVSAFLLAWGITRQGFSLLPIFGCAPFLWACSSGQMSPLITATGLIPALGWLALGKPNIGLSTIAYRTSTRALAGAVLLILISLFLNPRWPAEWLSAMTARSQIDSGKGIPVLLTGGPLLLVALARWRRPEARLFLVLACVPQTLMFYDQLPLWLIPRTRMQSATMGLLSLVGLLLGNRALPHVPTHGVVAAAYWPMIFATCYLPALAMLMREPNVGSVPVWMERSADVVSRTMSPLKALAASVARRLLEPRDVAFLPKGPSEKCVSTCLVDH